MPLLHEKPLCFGCLEEVELDEAVFAPVCGHEDCPSAVWHPLHLMEYREEQEAHQRDAPRRR